MTFLKNLLEFFFKELAAPFSFFSRLSINKMEQLKF
jgi:hypothetical protein